MFELLDLNKDGTVDLQEFISGLSFLCKGTPEEKLLRTWHSVLIICLLFCILRLFTKLRGHPPPQYAVSFKAYDLDGNGFITKDELCLMFKQAWISGFKALCTTHGNEELSMEELNEFAEEMATLFADNAFDTLDTNGTLGAPSITVSFNK
jgi:Ca2+-binding EF-hand superfamily protein